MLSMYNIIDVLAFGLPLAASINHFFILSNLTDGEPLENTNAGFLSFSVLFIFLHFQLFELRINQNVCKFVTIIIGAFIKIRMFFLISAGGIIAFSIAILHLLRSCPVESCVEPEEPTNFPSHFYGAVAATFFYMGGRYDSINAEFDSDNWTFQTLMIFYFFFTVILMLNVLIALINLAFTDGDETWYLVWLENRLRVVERVENLTFHIPGFRQHHDWFPEMIYYSATTMDIEEYRATDDHNGATPTSASSELDDGGADSSPDLQQDTPAMIEKPVQELKKELREQIVVLQDHIHEQKVTSENQNKVLQTHIQGQKASVEELGTALQKQIQDQLQEQRASAEKQIAALQEQNTALQEQMKELHAMLSFLTTKAMTGTS
ncbi:hypothetical protein BGZ50_004178 [Haplosporangium sp. Z 11]|nr:hypothetical protein BGZ50_004178 [Haplosporangium sp. Z 11]